jgi:hypothetical protein
LGTPAGNFVAVVEQVADGADLAYRAGLHLSQALQRLERAVRQYRSGQPGSGGEGVIVPTRRWRHAVVAATLAIPLLVVVAPSTLAGFVWPFLTTNL